MNYQDQRTPVPRDQREELNKKIIYLIDSGQAAEFGISREDIFNAYTGLGGLHGLKREDFGNYHEYSEEKKRFENGQFFTPPALCELVMACLRPSEHDLVADIKTLDMIQRYRTMLGKRLRKRSISEVFRTF